MIVATAGHVDHGKTSLVRALTGVDTDRLAEEKRRGMSIDLGFAYADFGAPNPVGFVDVPGHERFLRNMLAGVAAIDFVLLVIAADDGPMPQTQEHLAILELLGATRGAVALTKVDRVSRERVAEARAEVATLLDASQLRSAPVFEVATPLGVGLEPLRAHLAAQQRIAPGRAARGCFRMAIDRSFTVSGAGLVVTGAVFDGAAGIGDTLVLSPAGVTVRVRGIHALGRPADRAIAGQRCAINLAGADLRDTAVSRGDWLVAPVAHLPTDRIDVRLRLLASEPRGLARETPVQLHFGATFVDARVAPLDPRQLAPGSEGLAQVVTAKPVHAVAGDRFVVRDPAARRTLGGGTVIDPFGVDRGRAKAHRIAQLRAMQAPEPAQALRALLEATPDGLRVERFCRALNLLPEDAEALLAQTPLRILRVDEARVAVARARWDALEARLREALAQLHREAPEQVGVMRRPWLEAAGERRDSPVGDAVISDMLARGEVVREGPLLRDATHRPRLDPEDSALLARLVPLLSEAGLRAPIVGDVAHAIGAGRDETLSRLESLARRGHLVRVAPNRFFLPSTVDALAEVARALDVEAAGLGFDAAAYRDRSGIGRNLTIQVLEFLDRVGVTRFIGQRRHVVRP